MAASSFGERVVIITGGGGGVGRTVSLRWLAEGASVLAVDAMQPSLDALRAAWQEAAPSSPAEPERLAGFVGDVTTEEGAARMVAEAERVFGRPADTLLHLVGGFAMGRVDAPDAAATWEKMVALNLHAPFHCYRAMLPALRARGGGWIVGIGSRTAVTPPAKMAAYAASKAGLLALTQSLSAEVRAENIHVNVILASTIDTPANRREMGDEAAKNWVTPDDIADATLFLCSPGARSVYGATLEVYANA